MTTTTASRGSGVRAWLVVAALTAGAGCPQDPPPKGNGNGAADNAADGHWEGTCDVPDTVATESDHLGVTLDLTEEADGALSGTMMYTQFYTTTTTTYSGVFGLEGARDGANVTLTLISTTTTSTDVSLVFDLVLDGDTLDGSLSYVPASGYPSWSCSLSR